MSLSNLSVAIFSVASLVNRGPSLLSECLALIAGCNTMADCDRVSNDFRANGSVYSALAPADKAIVKIAGQTRRMMITMASIPGPVVAAAPISIVVSAEQDLARIATESTTNAQAIARTSRRARRTPTATDIAQATRVARLAGTALAGYNGRVIDPVDGIGTVIVLADVDEDNREIDQVSGRARQALIPWREVEAVRVACGLPDGSFGRVPGLVGILGKATQILNQGGFVARHSGSAGKFASVWKIGFFDSDMDSDSMGTREALITLTHSGEIDCTDPDHPGAKAVLADFARRAADTLIASDQLRLRIVACLRREFGARKTYLGLYVAPFQSARVMRLIDALRPIAGREIVAFAHGTDQGFGNALATALNSSITKEISKLEATIAEKLTEKSVTPALVSACEKLRAECVALASVLGPDVVEVYKARLVKCDSLVIEGMNETTQRAMNLEPY